MQGLIFGVAGFFLLFGIVVIAWSITHAECYEHEEDPIEPPGEDYNYSERPYYNGN